MKLKYLFLTICIAFFFPITTYSADLFSFIPKDRVISEVRGDQKSLMDKFEKEITTKTISIIRINLDLLKQDYVDLNLRSDLKVRTGTERIDKRTNTDYTWYGKLSEVPGNVILVVHGEKATGTIRSGKDLYWIRSIGSGLHALIQIDESKFPEEHPPSFKEKERQSIRLHPQIPDSRRDITSTIEVLVAYTASAQSATNDIGGLIQLAIDEANQSYQNSQINARLHLAHTHEVNYTETSNSFDTILAHLAGASDGFMDEIHNLRDNKAADIVVMIINKEDYCGLADAIMASAETAFALVHITCATGYYSFAHEIGHLLGCRHNPEADPNTTPFSYGHGYQSDSSWRTIMAYTCPAGCPRLQYWSNPNVVYQGLPMGTEQLHNNALVINQTAATVANFKGAEIQVVSLKTGKWEINANGHEGELNITAIDEKGSLSGNVYNQEILGFWDEVSKKITFIRIPNPLNPSGFQIYTGYLFNEEQKHMLTGSFEAFAGTGATAQRTLYGWYAQTKTGQ